VRHRRDIEGLRALAVVAVLLYHFGVPGFDGGFIGVDVFFVISGFLITSLLLHERTVSGTVSIKRFYARRARRLLPISATVIVATVIAAAVWLPATRLHNIAEDARAAALFGANLLFAHRGTNYLTAGLDPSPLRHYWSLAVEEQFYVIWPGLIALITIGAGNVRRRTAWAMGVIVVVSFTLSALLTADSPSWSYFGLHTRAWELGAGALLACLVTTVGRIPETARAVLGWLGLAGIVASAITVGAVAVFPGWAAALPVLATVAALVPGDHTPRSPAKALAFAPLQFVGARSYSLYLWHWPVIVIAEAHLLHPLTGPEKWAALAAVIVLAEAGFRGIEDPIRYSRPLNRRPGLSLALGAGLVCVGLVAGVVLNAYDPSLSTGVVAAAPVAITTTTPATTPSGTDPALTTTTVLAAPAPVTTYGLAAIPAVVDALANEVVPDNLRPSLRSAGGDTSAIYDNGCHQFGAAHVRTDCVFGDPNGTITIALWGDSHAAQWFTPLETMATAHHWRLLSLTQGSCAYIDVTVYDKKNDREFRNCGPWREAVRGYMREQGVDVVFVSEHYGLLSADSHQAISPQDWSDHLPPLVDSLRADGIEPIVIGDSPDPNTTVPDCVAAHTHHIGQCAASEYNADDLPLVEAIRSITTAAGVGFIEPGEWVCADDGRCPAVIGDILVYRDGNHLTDTVTQWIAPLVDALVAPFVEDYVAYRDVSR
jgi:peptidoglycan/LPS O-acetylase OafA/YrhL